MKLVIYAREGCPYCSKVVSAIDSCNYPNLIIIYYLDKDFTREDFQKAYPGATFPRGFLVKKGVKPQLLEDSASILEELDNSSS